MPNAAELQGLKELGYPFLILVAFGIALWRLGPMLLNKHETVVTKIAADAKAVVDKQAEVVDTLVETFKSEMKEEREAHKEERREDRERCDAQIRELTAVVRQGRG